MNKIKKFKTIALLSVFITFTVSCTINTDSKKISLDPSQTEVADIDESQTTAIVSQDKALQLTIPQSWKDIWSEAERERWSLLIEHSSGKAQIGVRSWSKTENPELTLDSMSEIALQAGVAPFADAEIVKEAEPISVNGYTAMQHQVRGTLAGYRFLAVSTAVETPHYYHLVFTLAPEQDLEQQWNEAQQIIQSLDEVQPTVSIQPNLNGNTHRDHFLDVPSLE